MTSSNYFVLDSLVTRIVAANPLQAHALTEALSNLQDEEKAELQDYLSFCTSAGIDMDDLAKAYQTITADTLREQMFFQRHGRYRYSSFREVADKVYFDPAYMACYMYGLALTLFLWPNHLEVLRFFRRVQPHKQGGSYLEVGPGHGIFFREAARNGGFSSCLGVDISPTSLELTRKLLSSDSRLEGVSWKLVNADFLAANDIQGRFDAIVMGELLEHVEQPLLFLLRIKELAKEGAFIFITTAVNAPAIDHIFLFRTVDEVHELVIAAGLQVKETLATPYKGCSMDETVQQKLPINVAMVLET